MVRNTLDQIPFDAERIRKMEKGSKAYRREVRSLRRRLNYSLSVEMMKTKKKDGQASVLCRRYRWCQYTVLLLCAVVLLIFMSQAVMVLFGGPSYFFLLQEVTKPFSVLIWGIIAILLVSCALSLLARRIMCQYISCLLEQYQPRVLPYSREYLSHVLNAYIYSKKNARFYHKKERYGCFGCGKTFQGKKKTSGRHLVCPHCGRATVIGERTGYPIQRHFLKAMHDYWM